MRASASLLIRAWPAIVAYAAVTIVTGVPSQAQVERFTPVTDAMLQNPAPEDWLMWRRTLAGATARWTRSTAKTWASYIWSGRGL